MLAVLSSLMMLLIGCGVKTEYKTVSIPDNLLEYKTLDKPVAKSNKDVVTHYIILYKEYQILINKLDAIKKLNN